MNKVEKREVEELARICSFDASTGFINLEQDRVYAARTLSMLHRMASRKSQGEIAGFIIQWGLLNLLEVRNFCLVMKDE
jgi:hypothetical protein